MTKTTTFSTSLRARFGRIWLSSGGLLAVAVAAILTLSARESRAEQFVLFDATFTFTWDDAMNSSPSKSHYYVTEKNWLNKMRPANFMTPVNYRDGTVHIHYEVLEKPAGTQQAGWALCYVANGGNYGCPYTDYYTKTGVYDKDVSMHSFFNSEQIQWNTGIKEVDCVYTVNGSGSGHITNFPALKDLVTPTRVRIAMVQVSQGSTYDPSLLPPASGDGGAPVPVVDAGRDASRDSGSTAGAGGSGGAGSGGAAGTGNAGTGNAGTGNAGTGNAGADMTGSATGAGGSTDPTTTSTGSATTGTTTGGAGGANTAAAGTTTSGATTGGVTTGGKPTAGDDGGCSMRPRSRAHDDAWIALGLLTLGLVARRRRAW